MENKVINVDKLDYCSTTNNILIEYDGEQHFKKTRFGNHIMTDSDLNLVKYKEDINSSYPKEILNNRHVYSDYIA